MIRRRVNEIEMKIAEQRKLRENLQQRLLRHQYKTTYQELHCRGRDEKQGTVEYQQKHILKTGSEKSLREKPKEKHSSGLGRPKSCGNISQIATK